MRCRSLLCACRRSRWPAFSALSCAPFLASLLPVAPCPFPARLHQSSLVASSFAVAAACPLAALPLGCCCLPVGLRLRWCRLLPFLFVSCVAVPGCLRPGSLSGRLLLVYAQRAVSSASLRPGGSGSWRALRLLRVAPRRADRALPRRPLLRLPFIARHRVCGARTYHSADFDNAPLI